MVEVSKSVVNRLGSNYTGPSRPGGALGRRALIAGLAAGLGLSALAAVAGTASLARAERSPAVSGETTTNAATQPDSTLARRVHYRTVSVDGVNIFYREAGPKDAPTILLLHGFPTSSHMFRNLIDDLSDTYHVIAPDYPGFGQSDMPSVDEFEYSFDNLARIIDGFTTELGLTRFAIYVQDYGAPIGFRIAAAHPDRITGLIIQNGNAYDEGLETFWDPIKAYWADPASPEHRENLTGLLNLEATKWQWTHGTQDPTTISPDTWTIDQALLDRPGNKEIQLRLFLSYGTNPPLYPEWQAYFRTHQPPALIVWGKNDFIFPASGAEPYKRDLKNLDFNLLDTGHFALEEMGHEIATRIRAFMADRVRAGR